MEYYRYLFDMDGTLFFTDDLNNESYNYALAAKNLETIHGKTRITRETVKKIYPELTEEEMLEIICQKQDYFSRNIALVHRNDFLFSILKRIEKEKCVLWTSADKNRVKRIIDEFLLHQYFDRVIFSNKKRMSEDINNICLELRCAAEHLLVFENDASIVKELECHHISCLLFVRA